MASWQKDVFWVSNVGFFYSLNYVLYLDIPEFKATSVPFGACFVCVVLLCKCAHVVMAVGAGGRHVILAAQYILCGETLLPGGYNFPKLYSDSVSS